MRTEPPIEMLAERYALEEELGRGGTGMVWRARDTVLERTVAVKILRPKLAEDRAFAERLAAETSAAARVSAPGFVRALETGIDRGISYLVREHIEGESLRVRLDRSGPLPISEAARVGTKVLAALATAHAAGVLHLDVKPENVLLGTDGEVRLADLGVGAATRATRPREAADLLSPTPRPPELDDLSAAPDARTDVYLAGALLFEALTGHAPAGSGSPRALRPETPRGLDAAIRRALASDRTQRFTDAATFAEAIDASTEEPPAAAREGHGLRAWVLVPAIVALAAALAIGLGLWLGRLEIGGPLGVRAADDGSPSPAPAQPSIVVLRIATVSTFDPFGDGTENDAGVESAVDGDPSTAWRSENYFDADLRKPGVGLLFDLGASRTVTGFRLEVPHPGYTFDLAVGDDPDTLPGTTIASYTASASMRETIEPTVGRYVLLWITSVVDAGDGDRAEVAEFKVIGSDA